MSALTIAMGLLSGVRAALSPNCDSRPANLVPELVVVHGISLPPGSYGGPWIERLFMNTLPAGEHPYFETIQHLRVSSHVLIARDGGLTQYVPFGMRAWHAGTSYWRGRGGCNDFSIGVELEGSDDEPYDDRQYEALADIVAALQRSLSVARRKAGSRATATSRPAARPIRVRISTGPGSSARFARVAPRSGARSLPEAPPRDSRDRNGDRGLRRAAGSCLRANAS